MTGSRARLIPRVAAFAGVAAALLAAPGTAAAQTTPTCFGKEATIVRGDGDDVVTGTRKSDVIVTGGGEDRVDGRSGRDRICTGTESDRVNGGSGGDFLDGGWHGDRVVGGPGADQAIGGPVLLMRWECIGGQWHQVTYDMSVVPAVRVDDVNTGQPCTAPPPPPIDRPAALDSDVLIGGSGPDRLIAGSGNDEVSGGPSGDRIFGQLGNDAIRGDSGADRIAAGPVLMTRWECRTGTWHLVTYDLSVDPPRQVDDIDTGQPCLPPSTPAIDPADDDVARGGTGADRISGGFAFDRLFGDAGADRLDGGAGEDILNGGRGRDRCVAGEATQSC